MRPPGTDASPAPPLRVHLVTHTHWDREWYQPLGRFRQRLVALVDELLDDPPAPGESFLLDGQTIALEDYLAVRPERRAELAVLLREGRIEAGPWYVLADELIPGGEALVRNLLAGRRTLRALRAAAPPVLYCPDSFGHPAALPAIARGFGLELVILWRGYGGARWPAGDTAWWLAPDGGRVLLFHLPPDGYEFGSNLPVEASAAAHRWAQIREVLAPRARLGVTLLQNGADHHARQLRHREAVAAVVAAAAPDVVTPSSITAFADEALARARAMQLPEVAGELRASYGYTWTLQGTFGTRAAQKRTNARAERLLVRDAEPWVAIARARAGRSRRALVDAAWRALLECHPHDTLCGCSLDAVARAADVRWEDAMVQGAGVREDALLDIVGHDPAIARERRSEWLPIVLVRNPSARQRSGLARLTIDSYVADVGVGPGSAGAPLVLPPVLPQPVLPAEYQLLSEAVVHARTESPRHYPDDDLVVRREVLLPVGALAGYGVRALPIAATGEHGDDGATDRRGGTALERVEVDGSAMSNDLLTVRVAPDGVIVLEAGDGRRIADLIGIECRGDAGDLYTPAIREPAQPARLVALDTTARGPWRGAFELTWEVPGTSGGEPSTLTVTVSLDAGEPFVRIGVAGIHRGADQRLRLLVRTGVRDPRVFADAAFGPAERAPLVVPEGDRLRETPPPTAPLHRYVSLFSAEHGATVYSDGLGEYEVMADGTVAVTLVRAVGELSRPDLAERPGNAGWPAATPEAQSIGPFGAELALFPHGHARDGHTIALIERTADDVLLPLTGETLRSALAIPAPADGAMLDGVGLAFSTLKESEDGEWIVARCVNLLETPVDGRWHFGWPVVEARLARLDETAMHPIAVGRNAGAHSVVDFTAGPREVVTVLVR